MNMHTLINEISEECYIARDLNETLYFYDAKPQVAGDDFMPSGDSDSIESNPKLFKSVAPGTCYKLKLSYKLVRVIDNEQR